MMHLGPAPCLFLGFLGTQPLTVSAAEQYNLSLFFSIWKYVGSSSAFLVKTEEEMQEGTESQPINDLSWSTPTSTPSTTTGHPA